MNTPRLKRRLFCSLIVASLVPGPAQAIFCSNCSSEWTQILNFGQLVASYAKQAAAYQMQILQYRDQLLHLKENPLAVLAPEVDRFAKDFAKLLNSGRNIAKDMATISRDMNALFKKPLGGNLAAQFKSWTTASTDALTNAMLSIGLHREHFNDDVSAVTALVGKNRASVGDLGALKTLGEISLQQLNESMKLRDMIQTQNEGINTYLLSEASKAQSVSQGNGAIMSVKQTPRPDPAKYRNLP